MIGAVALLLCCQFAGELVVRAAGLPLPGPVLGMAILFGILLARGGEPPAALVTVADGLLRNLGLLFIPAGVGVIVHIGLLAEAIVPVALAVSVGTLAAIAVTGKLMQALLGRTGSERR
jgi:holin-like protein